MTKTYQITFNPKRVSSKPKKNSLEMSNHLNGINVPTGITINEFANMVSGPNSHTWFGGTYNISITNQNWTSTQVIGLDFDSGDYTVEETIDKLKLNGIHPQLWYSSFSSTISNPKFRVVLFIDQPITNPEHRELIYKGLLQLVPHADVSCKNAARIFFGGKEAVILHNEPISIQSLIDSAAIAVITGDKGRSRYIPEELISTYYGENSEFLFNTNRNCPFLPNTPPNPITIMGKALPSINWIKAKERVRILKDFLDGKWLSHMQLFGLATNFIHVKGGQKLMNETMIKYNQEGKTDYSENNFNIITYVKKVAYRAVPIYKFSEHDEDADLHDLYSAVIDIRGKIELIKPIVLTPLALAEKTFKQRFQEALQKENDEKVYLFKVPTAIGKTELITQVNATLAFPTHSLKNEVKNRMEVKNVLSPDSIVFKDEKLNIRLQYLYGAGMLQKATAMIYDIASGKNSFEYYQDDKKTAAQYLKQLEESQVTKNTVLTTHTRALHINHSHSTIIFDEDPLETVLPIQIAQISDLVKVQLVGDKLFKPLLKYIQQLSSSEPGICHRTPTFEGDPEELVNLIAKVKPDSNLIDLLNSKYFIKDKRNQNTLHYILNNPLPPNKKIIILSATAPIPIYQELFKDRLEVIELTDVKQKGNIIQTTKQSCSRKSLTRYADSIAKKVGDTPVITFKSFKQYFKKPIEEMYFGNCSGYDNLKGQDISVVGTPHRNNVVYQLYSAILGGRTAINVDMVYQKIEYNGFIFKFNCYEDELLRNIQLSLIESDLIQAVGRARTLRTNATVQLYSNFPIRISSTFIF